MLVEIWGFGATGLACAAALRARGHTVVGIARSDRFQAEAAQLGVELRRGDLRQPEAVDGLLSAAEAVLVCAATRSIADVRDPARLYVEGHRLLRDFLAQRAPHPARVLVFSNTSVYGPASRLADGTIDETSPLDPQFQQRRGRPQREAMPNYTAAMEEVWREGPLRAILLRIPGIRKRERGALERMVASPGFDPPPRDRTYQTVRVEVLGRVVAELCERGEPGAIYNVTPPCVHSFVRRARAAAERQGLTIDWPPEVDLADHIMIVPRMLERLGIQLTEDDG